MRNSRTRRIAASRSCDALPWRQHFDVRRARDVGRHFGRDARGRRRASAASGSSQRAHEFARHAEDEVAAEHALAKAGQHARRRCWASRAPPPPTCRTRDRAPRDSPRDKPIGFCSTIADTSPGRAFAMAQRERHADARAHDVTARDAEMIEQREVIRRVGGPVVARPEASRATRRRCARRARSRGNRSDSAAIGSSQSCGTPGRRGIGAPALDARAQEARREQQHADNRRRAPRSGCCAVGGSSG